MKERLTYKRCGILIIVVCPIYLLLNFFWLDMDTTSSIIGAIVGIVSFAMFLFFIKWLVKEKEKNKEKEKKCHRKGVCVKARFRYKLKIHGSEKE